MSVRRFRMESMMTSVTACPWHLLDIVKGVFFVLTVTKKRTTLRFSHILSNIIRGYA